MGADRAILVKHGTEDEPDMGPLAVANVLAKLAVQENVDLIILGKQVKSGNQWRLVLSA